MVLNLNKFINRNKSYVLSGLNLAFLGSLFQRKIFFYQNLYHWPDGYLPLLISKKFKNVRKVAGRNLVRNLKLNKKIKHIHILGNLEQKQKIFLNKLKEKKIYFTKLPFENVENLAKICGSLKKGILYIITLPTPKQEQLAEILSIKNDHYKILLLGGAINILTGYEKEVPEKIRYFEFIWRLRFETLKRIKRLLFTSVSFVYHYIFDKKYRKLLN